MLKHLAALTAVTSAMLGFAAACATDVPGGNSSADRSTTSPSSSGTTPPSADASSSSRRISLTVDDLELTPDLNDTAASSDLLTQLPLTLTMSDHGSVEKTGRLPSPLSTAGVPSGADPDVGDLGYYAPYGDLVLYYGDQDYYEGIVRLGRIHGDLDAIGSLEDGFTVHIARAATAADAG